MTALLALAGSPLVWLIIVLLVMACMVLAYDQRHHRR